MKYKKIYEKRSYGRELIGYKCEKAFIEINTYDVTARGNFHKDYIVKELNKYKQLIIEWHIDFNDIDNKWKKKWFERFRNLLKSNTFTAALFLKLMRIYRNIFIQPFKIKWYK